MKIRDVEEQDAKAFLILLKEIDDSNNTLYNPGERSMTVEQQRKIIVAIKNNPRSVFMVAEKNSQLVGYIGLIAEKLQRTKHIGRVVVGVSDQSRGLGIGTKLFQEIFKWVEGKEFTRLELTIIETNIVAIKLYEKMGFIKEGKRVNSLYIDGKFIDEWSMYKMIK